jgi:hypothetical protein
VTGVAVAIYALLSIAIAAFHVAAWLAGSADLPRAAGGFFDRVGWPLATTLLGTAWTAALVLATRRIVTSPRPRPVAAMALLVATVLTPEILSAVVNVPYKGVSASEFLDAFLLPGGITPGGNGTLQHILMSAAAGGVTAVQLAYAFGGRRGVPS